MMRLVIVLLVATALASAQPTSPPPPLDVFFQFPADLVRYFGFSDSQVRMIAQLNTGFNRLAGVKQQRMFEVQREISEETAKDQLDPLALGLRYMELEVIRRELQDARATVVANIGGILNDAQKAKLRALEDALKLQPIISEAECENILSPPAITILDPTGGPGTISGILVPPTFIQACSFRTGDFLPAPGTGLPPVPNFPADLKQYFSFSGLQVSMIVQLNSEYNQLVASKQQRMFQVQQEIFAETAKDALDPVALGVRYAEIEGIRRGLQDALTAVRRSIGDVINAAQKARLKTLDDARNLQRIISDARCANILSPLESPWFNTPVFLTSPVSGFGFNSGCAVGVIGIPQTPP